MQWHIGRNYNSVNDFWMYIFVLSGGRGGEFFSKINWEIETVIEMNSSPRTLDSPTAFVPPRTAASPTASEKTASYELLVPNQ